MGLRLINYHRNCANNWTISVLWKFKMKPTSKKIFHQLNASWSRAWPVQWFFQFTLKSSTRSIISKSKAWVTQPSAFRRRHLYSDPHTKMFFCFLFFFFSCSQVHFTKVKTKVARTKGDLGCQFLKHYSLPLSIVLSFFINNINNAVSRLSALKFPNFSRFSLELLS